MPMFSRRESSYEAIHLPASALKKDTLLSTLHLTHLGRSEVLLIGTRSPEQNKFPLTITAAHTPARATPLRKDALPQGR